MDALPGDDPSHPESSLRVIPERHVLAEGEDRLGVEDVLYVHPGSVDLIVESEAFCLGWRGLFSDRLRYLRICECGLRDPALLEFDHPTRLPDQDHLTIVFIQEHHTLAPRHTTVFDQVLCDFFIADPRNQGPRVD